MRLCSLCNSANCSSFEEGECHICQGKALATDRMLDEALTLLAAEDCRSFSVSSLIPKDWLVREERVWDISMCPGSESVKSAINSRLVSSLRERSGLPYGSEGDCRLVFDYSSGNVTLARNDLFLFGRYRKLVPGLSQSRWLCRKCNGKGCKACEGKGKYYDSVEERIGEPLKKAASASDYTLHASGREDVDATNSAGRAFVIMLKNPKKRDIDAAAMEKEIAGSGEVSVSGLRFVPRRFVEIVTESHFDKSYKAEVEFGRELEEEDIAAIRSLEGKSILQKTPKRVLHRRANIVRHRRIKSIEVIESEGKAATVIIKAEAGTYIKELISGDEGRTEPSISGLLGTSALCKSLEVSDIDDGFLDFVSERF